VQHNASPVDRADNRTLGWIRFWLLLFITGLVISGATAIPLTRELSFLYRGLHHFGIEHGVVHDWLQHVYAALLDTQARYPFLNYGTDWLAFGHFAIAVAFIGPWRDPVRNIWVVQFGMIACVLIIPYALVFGEIRGIPWWWRAIDCSFGVFGIVPLVAVQRLTQRLARERSEPKERSSAPGARVSLPNDAKC
jgi:hypothetical protein